MEELVSLDADVIGICWESFAAGVSSRSRSVSEAAVVETGSISSASNQQCLSKHLAFCIDVLPAVTLDCCNANQRSWLLSFIPILFRRFQAIRYSRIAWAWYRCTSFESVLASSTRPFNELSCKWFVISTSCQIQLSDFSALNCVWRFCLPTQSKIPQICWADRPKGMLLTLLQASALPWCLLYQVCIERTKVCCVYVVIRLALKNSAFLATTVWCSAFKISYFIGILRLLGCFDDAASTILATGYFSRWQWLRVLLQLRSCWPHPNSIGVADAANEWREQFGYSYSSLNARGLGISIISHFLNIRISNPVHWWILRHHRCNFDEISCAWIPISARYVRCMVYKMIRSQLLTICRNIRSIFPYIISLL